MRYQPVDRPPFLVPGGPWPTTRRRWEAEGLPHGADLREYFGCDPYAMRSVAIQTVLYPPFEEIIVEETDEFVIKYDTHGVKVRNFRDEASMPEHLEYPIKGPESLPWLREKLAWDGPGRVDPDWLAKARAIREQGGHVFCNGGMYFAFLNEHMGTDRLMYAYFDQPDFIHEVNDLLCTLCEESLRTVLPHFALDCIGYHEDMAYKNGPLISPDMFREFMTPYYKRITAITEPAGIDLHIMDSDGDIRQLIPLWLECGINVVCPNEVAAGMDVVRLRDEYGHDLAMTGGFDKRILAADKASITAEVERLRPVIEEGGYICACDHGVPHDVPWENFCHFVDCLRVVCGVS